MTNTDLPVPIDAFPASRDPHPIAAIVHCLERSGLRVVAIWVDGVVRLRPTADATTERVVDPTPSLRECQP